MNVQDWETWQKRIRFVHREYGKCTTLDCPDCAELAVLIHVDKIVQAAREYVLALRLIDGDVPLPRVAGDALDNAEAALVAAVGEADATR